MPHFPGLATRQFYRSFYQWTVLTHETRPAARRHTVHTTARSREEIRESSGPRARTHVSAASTGRKRHEEAQRSRVKNGGAGRASRGNHQGKSGAGSGSVLGPGMRRVKLTKTSDLSTSRAPRCFTESPILSPSQKAFDSFKPREQVVRYRSPEGIMLELALPEDMLIKARLKWGNRLEHISKRSGARVEVQDISAPVGERLDERVHSVLISGTFAEVARAKEVIYSQSTKSSETVHSQQQLPSNALSPWQIVLRGREGSQNIAELRVLEDHWVSVAQSKDWGRFAMDNGVALEVGLLDSRPALIGLHQNAPERSLLLKGPSYSVTHFCDALASEVSKIKGNTIALDVPLSLAGSGPTAHDATKEDGSGSPAIRRTSHPPTGDQIVVDTKNAARTGSRGKASPQSSETPVRFVVCFFGKDAFHPGLTDAIWRGIGNPPPGVTISRTAELDQTNGRWYIEIFGPSCTVTSIRTQIESVLEQALRRFRLREVETMVSKTDNYKYSLTVTGEDAMVIKDEISFLSWRQELRTEYGIRIQWLELGNEKWQIKLLLRPKFLDQVAKRLLEVLQRAVKRLGFTRFRATLAIDTLDMVLPTAGSADGSARQNTSHSEQSSVGLTTRAIMVYEPQEPSPKAATAVQTADQERWREMHSPRGKFIAPPAVSQSEEPLRAEPRELKAIRPGRSPEQQKQLVEAVRASLRSLTHPVVLVTSRIVAESKKLSTEESARGVTVSSFNTVTLDPNPIISFNLKVPSRSWDAIRQSRMLRVHLLEASNRGAAVAQVFTKPHDRPEMGFEELRKLGLQVRISSSHDSPSVSDQKGAVLANLEADLLYDKCVAVGDHVVVLAEVTRVDMHTRGDEVSDGLAYARRGYRARGMEVVPAEIPTTIDGGLNDPMLFGAEGSVAKFYTPFTPQRVNINECKPSDPYATFNLDNDPIYNALRATKDAAESGEDIDVYAAMALEDEDCGGEIWPNERTKSKSKPISNKDARKEPHAPQHSVRRLGRAGDRDRQGENVSVDSYSTDERSGTSQSNQYRSVRPLAGETLIRPPQEIVAPSIDGRTGHASSQASVLSARRPYFTLAKLAGSNRSLSSSAIAYSQDREDSYHVDPAAKTTTVADFFGVPDDNKRPHIPRVRSLLRFQKDIQLAEKRLKSEELSDEETAALQSSVAHQERIIARKLAWNAAGDLRLMLDKGNARVNFKRAQWLEIAVEKGLKVLLEDARKLRQKREEGKVDAEQYEMLRQKLEGDHGVLQTELMRLREVADEDQDGGD